LVLHSLLQQTKADIERARTGMPPPRLEEPMEREYIRVAGNEYFLLVFYHHVSYTPRAYVNLSNWGTELTTEVTTDHACACFWGTVAPVGRVGARAGWHAGPT